MYPLRRIYGVKAHRAWKRSLKSRSPLTDLRPYQEDAGDRAARWVIRSYPELVQAASFLSMMNKRLFLWYRGQRSDHELLPSLLRESWYSQKLSKGVPIVGHRLDYWKALPDVARVAYRACEELGLPRWRAMKRVPEAQWAIVQHYELWPTPFLDITRSLRVAATFAFGQETGDPKPTIGHVYVLGMPAIDDSISIRFDDQLMLSRLEAVCPPVAARPHFQEGGLVARYPFTAHEGDGARQVHYDAKRRQIAHFEIHDSGGKSGFWTRDFPALNWSSLLPGKEDDRLLEWFDRHTDYKMDGEIVRFVGR
jgi:hypothetical protein